MTNKKDPNVSDSPYMKKSKVKQVTNYLSMKFNENVANVRKTKKLSEKQIKNYEVDMAWILHDIAKGPVFFVQNNINKANILIEKIENM